MSRLLLALSFIIVISSCSKLGSNEFLVKGKIENSLGKTIFLSEVDESGLVTVDSVLLDKEGGYKLKGKTSFPKFYLLRISPNDYVTLLVDSADIITVNADANDFVKSHIVEGSDDMVLVKSLVDRMDKTQAQIDSIGKIYESFVGSESLDSVKSEIDRQFNEIVTNQRDFSKKFIETNPGSMSSMLALSQQIIPQRVPVFVIPDDLAYFEKVDAELVKLYPGSKDAQQLHKFVGQVKEQAMQQSNAAGFGIGDVVPDISLNNPQGKVISLYSLKGKYVLLDFWAGWCSPCRQENPNLVENYKKYKNKGFEIFQVSLDKEKSQWIAAIEKDKLGEWKHVSDLQFWQSAPASEFNITSIPANFLLNPKGEVIAINLRGPALGAKLEELFR
jgi:peroxiredoxin